MNAPRVAWLLLASATSLWSVLIAAEPVYQISSCEAVQMDSACGQTIFTRYGAALALLLAIPVVLCALPAVTALRGSSWLVAVVLIVGPSSAVPTTDSMFGAAAYFLPVGIAALAVAAFQRWHERRLRPSAPARVHSGL
ncbi:hypothetical protein ACWDYH_07700 [Nocardia goodfellowii]